MDSRFQEDDKDEWIYNSMKKYSNLSMYELEFSADTLSVIGDSSLCLSGLQQYSKKCEILQLFIPPKLLPKRDNEEGLVKDRDFQIISGGYAFSRISQIQPLQESFVACTQLGENGVTIYKLGNDDYAVIKEHHKLSLPSSSLNFGASSSPGAMITSSSPSKIILGYSSSLLYEWDTSSSTGLYPLITHPLKHPNGFITKIKFWEEPHLLTYLTESGSIFMHDLRQDKQVASFTSTKPDATTDAKAEILYTFDTIPSHNLLSIVDSFGGYQRFDVRKPSTPTSTRTSLPFPTAGVVLRDKFNIEFSPWSRLGSTNSHHCIISGLKEQLIYVVEDNLEESSCLKSVFVHDGHSKTVTSALFHPHVERLVFSSSVDCMLHAWQYLPQH